MGRSVDMTVYTNTKPESVAYSKSFRI